MLGGCSAEFGLGEVHAGNVSAVAASNTQPHGEHDGFSRLPGDVVHAAVHDLHLTLTWSVLGSDCGCNTAGERFPADTVEVPEGPDDRGYSEDRLAPHPGPATWRGDVAVRFYTP